MVCWAYLLFKLLELFSVSLFVLLDAPVYFYEIALDVELYFVFSSTDALSIVAVALS